MLTDLFARFHLAQDDYRAQTAIVDSIQDGPIPDDLWQSQFDKSKAIYDVVLEICAYRPADAVEADEKARFLLAWADDNNGLEPDEAIALLKSMLNAPPVDKSNSGDNR